MSEKNPAANSRVRRDLELGDRVRVHTGHYTGMTGTVEAVYGALVGVRLSSTGTTKLIELRHIDVEFVGDDA